MLTVLSIVALLLQVGVVVYGYRMLRLVKWLDNWTPAWVMFILSAGIILLRRIIWTGNYMGLLESQPLMESVLTCFVSLFSLLFVLFMSKTFNKYIKKND